MAYSVEGARVGQRTDYDKLTLDIETDGSIEPAAALREAAEILISQLAIFTDADRVEELRAGPAGALDGAGGATAPAAVGGGGAAPGPDARHPHRGARARRPLVQLPQARGHPDRRRPHLEVRERARARSRTSARSRSTRSSRRSTRAGSTSATTRHEGRGRCATRRQRHKLSRDAAHRKSLLANLCKEVIEHERIKTTEAKAKAVKPEVEQLITLAKRGDLHARRQALATLGQDKFIVHKLFEEVAPRYAERPGGYTRILKLGPRRSDSTEMVFIELV